MSVDNLFLLHKLPAVLVVIITIGAVNVFLGLLVYLKERSNPLNRQFLVFILSVSTWIAGLLVVFTVQDETAALYGLRLAFAGAFLIAFTISHFAVIFPRRLFLIPFGLIPFLYVLAGIAVIFILTTDVLVKGVKLFPLGYQAFYGALYPLFTVYFIALFLGTIAVIFYKYLRADQYTRPQLRFFLIGVATSATMATTTNLIIPLITGLSSYSQYGPVAITPFVVLTAYAVVRHNLLEVKVIAAELFTFAMIFVLFIRLLLSQNREDLVFNGAMFLAISVLGNLLIRAVTKEVRSREKIAKLARELQVSNEELKKLDEAKSEFISIASHQLRAPLAIIKGYISLALEGTLGTISDQAKDALGKVTTSANQLVKLIGDLLNLSRIEAGKIKYVFTPTDAAKMLKGIVGEFQNAAAAKNKKLELESTVDALFLKLDPDKMREVFINLIDNGLKYARSKVTVSLEGALMEGKQALRLAVRDDGMGIAPQDLGKLFIKFSRTNEAQKNDPNGLGIGLYFAKRVVEDHGGKVWAESEGLEKGSTFIVELPVQQ